jgi:predicted nucleic acid-binding protein
MDKYSIYLDTSVINFLIAEDSPDFKMITEEFFKNHFNKFDVYISDIVLLEINKTKNAEKRKRLIQITEEYNFKFLDSLRDEKIKKLADLYQNLNIIPKDKYEDALHIAICTINEIDILLSWNFKHLANFKKQILVNEVNKNEGYSKRLNLINPMEVEYDEQ